MTTDTPADDDEITIEEAMQIAGVARDTLMRWKRDGKVSARTVEATFTQRQRRVLFKRSEIARRAGSDDQ